MRHTTRARMLITALAATTLAVPLAACTPTDDPTPTPPPTVSESATPTPTTTPTLSERDQNIADARAAYLDFVAADDAAAQTGFLDRDLAIAALSLTSGDAREAMVSRQAAFEQHGIVQTGSTVVKSLEATDYTEDPGELGMHSVKLRACVDPSDVDTLRDGESTQPSDQYVGPRIVYVEVLRQPGAWLVDTVDPRPEERC